jgi:hypothetical protein
MLMPEQPATNTIRKVAKQSPICMQLAKAVVGCLHGGIPLRSTNIQRQVEVQLDASGISNAS